MAPKASTKKATAKPKKTAMESQLEKLIAKQKATEKALAEANAKLVAKRNQELLDEDEEEITPPRKKTKASRAPDSDPFGEDDAAGLVGLLGSDRAIPTTDDDRSSEAGSDNAPLDDEDEDMSGPDGDSDDITAMHDSEMLTDEVSIKSKVTGHRRTGSKATSSRVTQSMFSPPSVRLANAGRYAVRVEIATKSGFPSDHAVFAWKALAERLAMAEKSEERRTQLTNYAWGGAVQLRGEVKALCKSAVALYGIPGDYTPTEIVKHVKWLTDKRGIFKYGGIDLKAQTYDVQQPYGAPFYKDVTTKQWFDTGKSEGVRLISFQSFVDSPVPMLTLVTGGMENSVKEWATGVRLQIKFTEDEFGPRYEHHRAALLNLQQKSPTWFAQFQRNLYSKIVATSNFPHLRRIVAVPDEGELDGVDFEALEAAATGKDKPEAVPAAPTAGPSLAA
ncbi:hypothetical protein DFH09DRAFT_1218922 [Mycena vulgaris]|nr:hypothetical protein DFH09DRAFT_1218922 [Mycena vulgaris]